MLVRHIIILFVLTLFLDCDLCAQREGNDTPLVLKPLNDSLDKYRFTDTSKYLLILEEVEALSQQRHDPQLESYYHFFSGFYKTDRGRFEEANRDFEKAIEISQSLEFIDHSLLFKVYYQNAFVTSRLSAVDVSRKYYWLSYDHAQYLSDSTSLALASYGVTSMLIEMGNYREAKNFANQTLDLDLSLQDSAAIAHDYGVLGTIYNKLKMYEKAFDYYSLGLKYCDKERSLHQFCNLNNAIADVSISLERFEDAVAHSNISILESNNADLSIYYFRGLVNKAHAEYMLGYKEASLQDLNLLLKEVRNEKLLREEIRILNLLGRLEKNNLKRFEYLDQALDLAKSSHTIAYFESIYRTKYAIINEHPNIAYRSKFKEEYITYLQGVENDNHEALINGMDNSFKLYTLDELNSKLQLTNKQKEIQLTKEKSKKIFFFSLLLLSSIGFLFFYLLQKQKSKLKTLEYSENLMMLEKRISRLVSNKDQEVMLPAIEDLNSKIVGHLTQKEYEILKDILEHKTNNEIAKRHHISVNTVKFHLKNINIKLDTPNKKAVIEKFSNN